MIFSTHRKKMEPRRRYGSRTFRDKIKTAASYKRIFNPDRGFKFLPSSNRALRAGIFAAVIVVLVAVYYLTISSAFLVTNITIKGNRQVSTGQILDVLDTDSNSRLFLMKKNNYFL